MGARDNHVAAARSVVERLGGRLSSELGLDLDHRPQDVERWLLIASLFGNPILSSTVVRTVRSLCEGGVRTPADAGDTSWRELVRLLDAGGYVRYDSPGSARSRSGSSSASCAAFGGERGRRSTHEGSVRPSTLALYEHVSLKRFASSAPSRRAQESICATSRPASSGSSWSTGAGASVRVGRSALSSLRAIHFGSRSSAEA
jgi:hypothetical protein